MVISRVKCSRIHMMTPPAASAMPAQPNWRQAPMVRTTMAKGARILLKFMDGMFVTKCL